MWCTTALPAAAQHNESSAGARVATAQRVRAVRVLPGVQLGGVLPSSELGNLYGTGLRAGATLTAIVPTKPYGVRLALTYDRLSGGTVAVPGQPVRQVEAGSMVSVTVAGLYTERAARSALLYATGGLGVHRLDAADTAPRGDDEPTDDPDEPVASAGAETKFGATIGGGLTFRIGGLPSYLEVQVVKLFGADAILVPLVVGIQLGR
jgi:opacity protein-like surface antigen